MVKRTLKGDVIAHLKQQQAPYCFITTAFLGNGLNRYVFLNLLRLLAHAGCPWYPRNVVSSPN